MFSARAFAQIGDGSSSLITAAARLRGWSTVPWRGEASTPDRAPSVFWGAVDQGTAESGVTVTSLVNAVNEPSTLARIFTRYSASGSSPRSTQWELDGDQSQAGQ